MTHGQYHHGSMSHYAQGQSLMRTAESQEGLSTLLHSQRSSDCLQDALGACQLNTSIVVDAHAVTYPAVISETMCFGSLQELLAKLADKPLRALQRLMIAVDAAKVSSPPLSTSREAFECSAAAQDGFYTHGRRLCSVHL